MRGAEESAAWIARRGLDVSSNPHWYVEITIPTETAEARFEINVYPEEWGIVFRRGIRVSSIRVTDIAFVHGLDEHRLLAQVPPLEDMAQLLALLERRYEVAFHRMRASIRSNLRRAAASVPAWLISV